MPALPVAPNVIKHTTTFTDGLDLTAQVILHWRYPEASGSLSAADCVYFATQFHSFAAAEFPALMDTDTHLTETTVRDLGSATGHEGSFGGDHVGVRTGGILPASTAVLVSYAISRPYRGGKPRSYWPFGTSTDIDTTKQWLSGSVTAFGANLATFYSQCKTTVAGGAAADQVSVSYYGPPNLVVTNPVTGRARTVSTRRGAPIVDVISSATVRPRIGSQRRRTR